MHFIALYTAFVLVLGAFAASPAPKVPKKAPSGTSGRYIVSLKPTINRETVKSHHGIISTPDHDWNIINAFVIDGNNKTALDALLNDPSVDVVEEDGIGTVGTLITQTNAPWGLGRITSTSLLSAICFSTLNYQFQYDDAFAGNGVDVYVVDTGIRTTHSQFQGRARWGATFGPSASADGNGHGTHVAGTVGGSQFGLAKRVSLIAVKVLPDSGSGPWSDIISGINWSVGQAQSSGRPSIIQMSIYGDPSDAVDNAVTAAVNAGVHVVICAGNNNTDAENFSPPRNRFALTIGASTINDTRASFSNFGIYVDVYAPGQDVISSWFTSDTAIATLSGTSMAAPHVSGIVAYIISKSGNMSPANMGLQIQNQALRRIMPDQPRPNMLAHNLA
ncbi:serine protease [Flagelloscypha sp. PMI_526]|nr:serine protease [Flagelloscypha sp. PMI_526]